MCKDDILHHHTYIETAEHNAVFEMLKLYHTGVVTVNHLTLKNNI